MCSGEFLGGKVAVGACKRNVSKGGEEREKEPMSGCWGFDYYYYFFI